MRLSKTIYIIETVQSDTPSGMDEFDRPIYEDIPTKTPFLAEVEPYSSKMAEQRYGVMVEVSNRVFCLPNDKIRIKSIIEYNGLDFEVTEFTAYDNH
ncbi:hypothetical protein [Neobacillus cucumis]|uniref:Uncharacterized protein n=1 Tax=Neobacillus cucumis TaxID=1740721 RepID=A0A2N5HER5_9BACI|nr:hypothetical protein [Neobacillus cucumis]PLS04024.1 hypothetical protein CVD27_12755 [Neobacillus cucumis]